ncbi:hypothetical protein CISIN_1g0036291mg, partial [Citrus sinensis]
VLNDEMFAILVVMALFTTFMTTPMVMAIYKPLRRLTPQNQQGLERQSPSSKNSKDEFKIQACVHGPENVPALINLTELIRTTEGSTLKLYVMRLVELTDRSSSILTVQKTRKNGLPLVNRFRRAGMSHDQIVASLEAYNQLRRVTVRHSTAISALSTMHEDIFHVAEEKRVAMIVLPFHKQRRGEGEEEIDSVSHGWREVNRTVLLNAPCSVAVLVDRGFGCGAHLTVAEPAATVPKRVCIVFLGGPDDRRALDLGGRMAENSGVKVTLVRFVHQASGAATGGIAERATSDISTENGISLDEAAVDDFMRKCDGSVECEEKVMGTVKDEVLKIGQSRDYELVVAGKGRFPSTALAELADHQPENVGLGPIGNILASSDHGILASVLVIQQHNAADINEATV